MISELLSDGWVFRTKTGLFDETGTSHEWVPVHVPHDAMIATARSASAPGGAASAYFPDGVWEYRISIDVSASDLDGRVLLSFEGVYRSAVVFVNGQVADRWPDGYGDRVVDLTPHLRAGADNEIRVEARAFRDSRWYTGAGIYRPVHIIRTSLMHIGFDEPAVSTSISGTGAHIEVATSVENVDRLPGVARVRVVIRNPEDEIVATDSAPVTVSAQGTAVVRCRFLLEDADLWSPETPSLYSVQVFLERDAVVLDSARTTFGVRSLELDPVHGLRVNGAVVKLRGACIHHDNGVLGAATYEEAEERRARKLKEAGFNAIRSAHNTVSRAMLNACDRLGLLIMDEAFDSWSESKTEFDFALDFPEHWSGVLRGMVLKDRNHPSVFAYSIGNEIPEVAKSTGRMWARRLAEEVRTLDSTRFITAGVNAALAVTTPPPSVESDEESSGGDTARPPSGGLNAMIAGAGDFFNRLGASDAVTVATEETFSVLDIAGMNYMDARYEADRERFPHRVIVGSETFPTRIDTLWDLVLRNPHVIGDFTWTGWDYLGEAGIGRSTYADEEVRSFAGEFPWLVAGCGDIDITGRRRPASFYREIVYGRRSTPFIAVQDPAVFDRPDTSSPWSWGAYSDSWTWAGSEYTPIRVEVYSDADEVELQVCGEVIGRAAAGAANRFRGTFETAYRPGMITATAIRGGEPGESWSLQTAGVPDGVSLSLDAARPITVGGLAFVDIAVVDVEGVVAKDPATVRVSLDGPGVLQALGNADPLNLTGYSNTSSPVHDGFALAVIRATGEGTIRVTVTAEGLNPAEVTFAAQRFRK